MLPFQEARNAAKAGFTNIKKFYCPRDELFIIKIPLCDPPLAGIAKLLSGWKRGDTVRTAGRAVNA